MFAAVDFVLLEPSRSPNIITATNIIMKIMNGNNIAITTILTIVDAVFLFFAICSSVICPVGVWLAFEPAIRPIPRKLAIFSPIMRSPAFATTPFTIESFLPAILALRKRFLRPSETSVFCKFFTSAGVSASCLWRAFILRYFADLIQ